MKTPPKKIFITYSHKNAAQKESLEVALAVMEQNNEIKIWSDAKILPGDKWEKEIKVKLEESDTLFYLVSSFSLASKNCNKELADILSKNQNIEIIPIILEDCDFLHHPLAQFEALPTKDKDIVPISRWKRQSEAWQNVVEGIRKKLAGIPSESTQEKSDTSPPASQGTPSATLTPTQATVEFLFERANFFLMLENYDAAIHDYTKALKLNPTADAYNNRAFAYGKKGELDKTIDDFNQAIALNPNSAEIYNNRGNSYGYKDDHNKAIDDFNQAIVLNPDYAEAYFNRGVAKHALRNYKETKQDFEITLKLAEQQGNFPLVIRTKKAITAILADFNKAIALNPNDAEAYVNLGSAKKALQDYKGAKKDLQIVLKMAEQQGNKTLATHIQKDITDIPTDPD